MSVAAPTSRFVVGLNGHPRIATLFPAAAGAERDRTHSRSRSPQGMILLNLVSLSDDAFFLAMCRDFDAHCHLPDEPAVRRRGASPIS